MSSYDKNNDFYVEAKEWAFHHTPWEAEFLFRFSQWPSIIRIACPFIKLRMVRLIISSLPERIEGPSEIKIITRLNKRDCLANVHDISALWMLFRNPIPERCRISVRINNGLHAKCFIFDDKELIITSSNLTYAGMNRNIEMALATSKTDIVRPVIDYFDYIFSTSEPLTRDLLRAIKQEIFTGVCDKETTLIEEEEALAASEILPAIEAEESTKFKLDPDSIKEIDNAAAEEFAEDIEHTTVTLADSVSNRVLTMEDKTEREFYSDISMRFRAVFGEPVPDENQIAAIFTHSSVHPLLKTVNVDIAYTEQLELIGINAINLAVLNIIFNTVSEGQSPLSLQSKLNYITNSDHLLRQLIKLGIAYILVGRSLKGSSEASNRAKEGILKSFANRLVGFLMRSHTWTDFVHIIAKTLNLSESFPFESYHSFDYKTVLENEECKRGASPEYVVVAEDGLQHNKMFTVEVRIGARVLGRGQGPTKKMAEWEAAGNALKKVHLEAESLKKKRKQPASERVLKNCRELGRELIKRMTGQELPETFLYAILLPTGLPRCESADLRELFVVIGGSVRWLCVVISCTTEQKLPRTIKEIGVAISKMNSHNSIVARVEETPLKQWNEYISSIKQFRHSEKKNVVVETVAACFGALLVHGGLESCRVLSKVFFDERPESSVECAKSRLLNRVREQFKTQSDKFLQFESTPTHKPKEAYKARFICKVIFCGQIIGSGEGSKVKEAEEVACEKALNNPIFGELLERESLKRVDSKADTHTMDN